MAFSSTIEDMAKKYNNFYEPSLVVLIDDKEVESNSLIIENASVTLTSGCESSVCSLSVVAADSQYENDKISASKNLESFSLGAKIEIKVAYSNSNNESIIFSGYITSVDFEYGADELVRYNIEAMDVKFFMMNNLRSELKPDIKKYSEAVTNVLKDYSSLYESSSIDQTDDVNITIEQYNQSDYDFIVSMAKKVNYLFYVVNGVVYFKSYTSDRQSILTIYPCEYLMYFKRETTLAEQVKKVTVRSNDELNPSTPIEATVVNVETVGKGQKSSVDISTRIDEGMHKIIIDNTVKSKAEAERIAQAELNKASLKFATGEFQTYGIPDLVPGKYVTVTKFNDDINNDYFIKEVNHNISPGKFITTCKYEVNKI